MSSMLRIAPALGIEALRAGFLRKEWPAVKIARASGLSKSYASEWRLEDVLQSGRAGSRVERTPEHEDTSVLVWRQNALVYYRSLERLERGRSSSSSRKARAFAAICESRSGWRRRKPIKWVLIGRLNGALVGGREFIAATDACP